MSNCWQRPDAAHTSLLTQNHHSQIKPVRWVGSLTKVTAQQSNQARMHWKQALTGEARVDTSDPRLTTAEVHFSLPSIHPSIHLPALQSGCLRGLLTAPRTRGRPDPFSSLPLLQLISPHFSDWPQIYKPFSDSLHGSFVQLPLQYHHTRPHLSCMTCMTFALLFLVERVVSLSDSTLEINPATRWCSWHFSKFAYVCKLALMFWC